MATPPVIFAARGIWFHSIFPSESSFPLSPLKFVIGTGPSSRSQLSAGGLLAGGSATGTLLSDISSSGRDEDSGGAEGAELSFALEAELSPLDVLLVVFGGVVGVVPETTVVVVLVYTVFSGSGE